jgi:hypothetical protein
MTHFGQTGKETVHILPLGPGEKTVTSKCERFEPHFVQWSLRGSSARESKRPSTAARIVGDDIHLFTFEGEERLCFSELVALCFMSNSISSNNLLETPVVGLLQNTNNFHALGDWSVLLRDPNFNGLAARTSKAQSTIALSGGGSGVDADGI